MSGYRTLYREEPNPNEEPNPLWSASFVGSNILYVATAAGYVRAYCIRSRTVSENDTVLDGRGLHVQLFCNLYPLESRKDVSTASLMLCQVKALSLGSSNDGKSCRNLVCAVSLDGNVVVWEHEFDQDLIEFGDKDIDNISVKSVYMKHLFHCQGATGISLALSKYNHNDYHAAVGCRDGSIKIVVITSGPKRAPPGQWIETIDGISINAMCIYSLAWSTCGNFIASGHKDGMVYVSKRVDDNTSNGTFYFKRLHSISAHRKAVRSIEFTADNQLLITVSEDGSSNTYDFHRPGPVALTGVYQTHDSWALGVASHPNSRHFFTAGGDRKVKVWDITMRESVHTFDGSHTDKIWCVVCNEDGTRLVSCGDDGKLVFYSCDENK